MQKNCNKLLICFLFLLLCSCGQNKRSVQQSNQALRTAIASQQSASEILEKIANQAEIARSNGKIDSSTYDGLSSYLASEREVVENSKEELQTALLGLDSYKNARSAKKQGEIIQNANKSVEHSAELLRILEKKTEVILDFLGSETFSKAEIGALFRPGEYILFHEQSLQGERLFKPIVEKLFTFADKYKSSFNNLSGKIIVTGYSDGTAVEKGSSLFIDLAKRLKQDNAIDNPTNQQLNQKLSELRAAAVKELLEKIIEKRNSKNDAELKIEVSILGRGEQIPPFLEKTSKNDSRRRIVTFYWVVLPGL